MVKKAKVRKKLPSYMKGSVARKAQSGGGRKTHKDYFVPQKDVTYWVVLLPAHPDHPEDESGSPSPFVTVRRYFDYRTPDGDIRAWPIMSDDIVKAGKDPLFKRAARLLGDSDYETRRLGGKLSAKSRVLMNVLVIGKKEGSTTTKGKDLGKLGEKPLIMEVGSTTWADKFVPLIMEGTDDFEEEESGYCDVFGQETDVVPVIKIKKVSKGKQAFEVDWQASRTSSVFEITKKHRKGVFNIAAHETTQPHTAEELRECMNMAAVGEADSSEDSPDIDFDDDDVEEHTDDDTEVMDDPDDDEDEDEEEEKKPKKKKKGKKKKSSKKKEKKAKKKKKEEEEEDDDDDEDFMNDDDDDDDDEEFMNDDDDEEDDE